MLRDPFTGDIEPDAVIRIVTIVGIISIFAMLGSISEGENWYYPYELIIDFAITHSTITIASFMVIIMAYWWYEQFRGGYF
jgi:hypothetical protein